MGLEFLTELGGNALSALWPEAMLGAVSGALPVAQIGLDQMLINLSTGIVEPLVRLVVVAILPILAIVLVGIGVVRLSKAGQPGARGTGAGTAMYFVVGGTFASFSYVLNAMSNSLFDPGTAADMTKLSYKAVEEIGKAKGVNSDQLVKVIKAVFAIVAVVGLIAVVRGLFILKAHSDGNSQASMGQGAVFIAGGVLAWNIGAVVGAVCVTLGIPACLG